ncbi:hypothetical protein GO495_08225 [Chitinophaga oryziterrae]|uniref:Uncharacterized protein n=1 Tax=Chitinophaga oryziterrae TaxID=1031224 RepID=A0A6N8J8F2_9BACT|nr:hypothetical protein [Chitinophaga oryziterrae]MVT40566.1 hypothetical protein [Chitinophaga oryziterrae]
MKTIHCFLTITFLSLFVTPIGIRAQGTRVYRQNLLISGQTEDSQGANYLLLHKLYTSTLLPDNHVQGKITAIRGGVGAYNRKWTVEVNTSSAYNGNRGSIISYNEPASLVTLTYNSENYLAVSIQNGASLYNFSFTGYAQAEVLLLVTDNNVSNILPFTSLDPIIIQGNVGIGTTSFGSHMLAVEGSIGARRIKVRQTGWADFVFHPDYHLPPLQEVENYINTNKHLSGIPTTEDVEKDGIDLGEMNKILLQKVEELTLYLIEQSKRNIEMEKRTTALTERLEKLEAK